MTYQELVDKIRKDIQYNTVGMITGDTLQTILLDIVDLINVIPGQTTPGNLPIIGADGEIIDSGRTLEELFNQIQTGLQGVTGPQGVTGVQGIKGDIGPQGVTGPAGSGIDGIQGPEGPQGVTGERGPEGPQGVTGIGGAAGLRGPEGPQGITGERGPTGPHGAQGVTGPAGNEYTPGQNITIVGDTISAIGYIYDKDNYSHAEGQYTTASGTYSHAEGISTFAIGEASHAEGGSNTAEGQFSHAEGSGTVASGFASHAEGNMTDAIGLASHAEGDQTEASGDFSHTEGKYTIASGMYSHAGGESSEAQHDKSFAHGDHVVTSNESMAVFGKYSTKLTDWNVRLQVGDGTSTDSTRNIFVVQGMTPEGSEGGVHARGAFKPDAGYINDFAEYFEWVDGNPEGEDRIGILVELVENKITPANSFENCIGAVSATSGFTGGACSLEWHGKYLRDKWGRLQTERIGDTLVPVLNPNYDPNKTYISREKRPEWAPIGLVGQVLVRQDGSLKVGGRAGCKNGIAIDATKGFRVLQIVDEETAIVLIK